MKRKAWKKYPDKDMRLFSFKDYMTFAKGELIEYITMALTELPKRKLARLAYNLTKSKLPRLRKTDGHRGKLTLQEIQKERKRFDERMAPRLKPKRKTKRKFSRKQLAAQRLFAKRARAGTLRR